VRCLDTVRRLRRRQLAVRHHQGRDRGLDAELAADHSAEGTTDSVAHIFLTFAQHSVCGVVRKILGQLSMQFAQLFVSGFDELTSHYLDAFGFV
jgi:hypothetical protein